MRIMAAMFAIIWISAEGFGQVQVPGYPRVMPQLVDSSEREWSVSGGLELSETARPGWWAEADYGDRWGWTGLFTGSTEVLEGFSSTTDTTTRTVTDGHAGYRKYRGKKKFWSHLTSETVTDTTTTLTGGSARHVTYGLYTGPRLRVFDHESVSVRCRGVGGTIYRGTDERGFWRLGVRAGCGVDYALDSDSHIRAGVDYVYASPGTHVPAIYAGYGVRF